MKNVRQKLILLLAGGLILFNLYSLAWLPPDPYVYRGAFISVCIILVNLIKPPRKTIAKVLMGIFTLLALVGPVYAMVFADKLASQYHYATQIEIYVFIIFIIGLFGVLTRVEAGVVFLGLLATAILYLFLGQYIPGLFGHAPLRLAFVASILYTDITQGAFGSFSDIFTRIVSIFMVFAALLVATGLGDLFTAIACRIAGNATGGPAKVSIFSSALFGMISGSPAANVLATGSFTIPTMKSVGYSPSMAATVEAIASTGGVMVPPIMGASAFIMAELTGVPYLMICVVAIIPAFLWYYTCFFTVHFYALRVRIKKWQPPITETMAIVKAKGHLLMAIPALIAGMYFFASAEQGAFFGVIFLFLLTLVRKETRLNRAKIVTFLRAYADMFAGLLVFAVAIAIFIAAVVGTGVHLKLGSLLLARVEQWYIVLLLTAAMEIVLGMCVSTMATYLAVIMIVAPILSQMGFNLLAVHMFVLFLAALGPITPPVCLATFTAAKLAGSGTMKTGLEAMIKSIPLWIVPFALVRKNLFLGIGTPLSVIITEVGILCFGILVFVLGAQGYFRRKLTGFERTLAIATGIMIAQPISDLYSRVFAAIGLVLLVYWWLSYFMAMRKDKYGTPEVSV